MDGQEVAFVPLRSPYRFADEEGSYGLQLIHSLRVKSPPWNREVDQLEAPAKEV